jgi:hypothetical protein
MFEKAKTTFGISAANYKLPFLRIFFLHVFADVSRLFVKISVTFCTIPCLSRAVRIAKVLKGLFESHYKTENTTIGSFFNFEGTRNSFKKL